LIEVIEPGDSDKVIRHFLSMRVEAVVFIGHFDEDQLTRQVGELVTRGIPHLLIDQVGIKGANTVSLDRVSAMTALVKHLTALGHRSFGILAFNSPARGVVDRLRGIHEALASEGLDFTQCTSALDGPYPRANDFEEGRRMAQAFVERGHVPTAYIGQRRSGYRRLARVSGTRIAGARGRLSGGIQ
jgi:DNA-binding LacI/PurR family transcriptional regulator